MGIDDFIGNTCLLAIEASGQCCANFLALHGESPPLLTLKGVVPNEVLPDELPVQTETAGSENENHHQTADE